MAKDPICGMTVDEATALSFELERQIFYFCSEHCLTKFEDWGVTRVIQNNGPRMTQIAYG